MVGIVIASHGEFCNGLKSSAEMIAGEAKNCECVPLYPEDDPQQYGNKIAQAIDKVDNGLGVLVFTDIRDRKSTRLNSSHT